MSLTLKDFKQRIDKMDKYSKGCVDLKQNWAERGNVEMVLGLTPIDPKKPHNKQGFIVPVTLTFNQKGEPVQVQFPFQNSSGSLYVEPTDKLLSVLHKNMGRYGGDFLAQVSNGIAGTRYDANHYDTAQSFGMNATGEVAQRHAEAVQKIVGALREMGAAIDVKPLAAAKSIAG